MSVESKVQSLITAVNSVTGESRTDLTACVQDLKDGYEQGEDNEIDNGTYLRLANGSWMSYPSYRILRTNDNTANLVITPQNVTESIRVIHRFKKIANQSAWTLLYSSSASNGSDGIILGFNNDSSQKMFVSNGTTSPNNIYFDTIISNDLWYYVCVVTDVVNKKLIGFIYDDNGELVEKKEVSFTSMQTENIGFIAESHYYLGNYSSPHFSGLRDLSATYYEVDGVAMWGKLTSKTENMGLEIT